MWDEAFVYDDSNMSTAYTMWYFDASNPNDATTQRRGDQVPDECLIRGFQKDRPGPEVCLHFSRGIWALPPCPLL